MFSALWNRYICIGEITVWKHTLENKNSSFECKCNSCNWLWQQQPIFRPSQSVTSWKVYYEGHERVGHTEGCLPMYINHSVHKSPSCFCHSLSAYATQAWPGMNQPPETVLMEHFGTVWECGHCKRCRTGGIFVLNDIWIYISSSHFYSGCHP